MKRLPADFPYFVTAISVAAIFAVFTAFLDLKLAIVELCVILIFAAVWLFRMKHTSANNLRLMKELAVHLEPSEKTPSALFRFRFSFVTRRVRFCG